MVNVELRGGEIARPAGFQGRWGPGRYVEGLGVIWRPHFNRYGRLYTYVNIRGELVEAYNPRCVCKKCLTKRNTHTGRPPHGWVEFEDAYLCSRCKPR